MLDLGTLTVKAAEYKNVLSNTESFRAKWNPELKPMIKKTLKEILKQTEIKGEIEVNDAIENLESVVLSLGRTSSGIAETIEDTDVKRFMIKSNGALIYQQLFNGKVMVMTVAPFIEGYGQPSAPKPLEILRPQELNPNFIIRHVETFLKEITDWEDYDDGKKTERNAFNPIGFQRDAE